jgi:molybdenum transport protein
MTLIPQSDIDRFLAEDAPYGDLTSHLLGLDGHAAHMTFSARGPMVLACSEEAARIIATAGGQVRTVLPSATRVAAGQVFLSASGPATTLLLAWKVAQTLCECASGIATAAARIVDAARARAPGIAVACTRSTFPGTRAVSIKSIQAGVAVPHRLGLSETVLVFPEHRAFLGERPLAETVSGLKAKAPERKIVIEVCSTADAVEAAKAGADVVQLEKFTPAQAAEVVTALSGSAALIAAAGGVNGDNAAQYAETGVHILVSSAPYWAKPADVKVVITPCVNV